MAVVSSHNNQDPIELDQVHVSLCPHHSSESEEIQLLQQQAQYNTVEKARFENLRREEDEEECRSTLSKLKKSLKQILARRRNVIILIIIASILTTVIPLTVVLTLRPTCKDKIGSFDGKILDVNINYLRYTDDSGHYKTQFECEYINTGSEAAYFSFKVYDYHGHDIGQQSYQYLLPEQLQQNEDIYAYEYGQYSRAQSYEIKLYVYPDGNPYSEKKLVDYRWVFQAY
eukprot:TRINITY_DN41032_c0_g1_i5.p2 TRINITY_DN41032_c0_g1~~TRINITY_DN41032_c0_g1_i5.p2  ORF type:complete len:229 (-),score=6.22 TRINITY_DN41032_c0_g1_i5:854-1540(-)